MGGQSMEDENVGHMMLMGRWRMHT